MVEENLIGPCGLYCGWCPFYVVGSKEFTYKYGEWIGYVTKDFEFKNFMRGLSWFANACCVGCLLGGGMPKCEVRNCCREKGLKNCYFCEDSLECEKIGIKKKLIRLMKIMIG